MIGNDIRCINNAIRSDHTRCAFTPVDFWPSSNTETFCTMKYFLLIHNRHWCVYISVMSFLCEIKSSILNGDKGCDTLLTPSYCGDLKFDSIFNLCRLPPMNSKPIVLLSSLIHEITIGVQRWLGCYIVLYRRYRSRVVYCWEYCSATGVQ
jgi:hypothetical protein